MKLVITILLLVMVLFESAFARSGCAVNRIETDKIRKYNRHYGYDDDSDYEFIYKYYLNCTLTSLYMGVPLTNDVTGSYSSEATNAVTINFVESTINKIPVGVFHSFDTAEELILSRTSIATIAPGALGGMTSLTTLRLEHNNITDIQEGTFDGLIKLHTLDLSDNNLITLKALNELINLVDLDLENNRIKTIDENAFKTTVKLQTLNLSNNNLVNLSAILFSTTTELKTVKLNNNSIENIPNGLFSKIQQITSLDLSYNKIQSIPCELYYSETMKHFDISHNKITSFPPKIFNQSVLLETLNLNNNNISNIHEDHFVGLENLKILDISNNRINTIPMGTFRELSLLTSLNVSHNVLEHLEFGTFGRLASLQTLDLAYNKIAKLEAKVLFPLESLSHLYLDSNLLRTFDPVTISSHLNSLEQITLDHNQMKCDWLTSCMQVFRLHKINVQPGNSYKTNNVRGIQCIADVQEDSSTANGKSTTVTPAKITTILATTEKQIITTANQIIHIRRTIPTMSPKSASSEKVKEEFSTLSAFNTEIPVEQEPTFNPVTDNESLKPTSALFPKMAMAFSTLSSSNTEMPHKVDSTLKTPMDTLDDNESQHSVSSNEMIAAFHIQDEKFIDILKPISAIHSLLVFVTVVVIIYIIINLAISMYSIKRKNIENNRKSISSCAVELLNVND